MTTREKLAHRDYAQTICILLAVMSFSASLLAPPAVSQNLRISELPHSQIVELIRNGHGRWAIIDTYGKVLSEAPWFNELRPPRIFKFGVAKVGPRGARGLINNEGVSICKPIYEDIGEFAEGLAPVLLNNKVGYIDATGQMKIDPFFDDGASFAEGLAAVTVGTKIGFIDIQGKWIIKPQFQIVGGFSEGLCYVRVDDEASFIDKSGQKLFSINNDIALPEWSSRTPISALFQRNELLSKKIDFDETTSICSQFSDGLAAMTATGKAGFIDKSGKFAIAPSFEEAHPFNCGLARVKAKGEYGFIDTRGKYVIKPRFKLAHDFSDGVAAVQVAPNRWTYINKNGKYVTKQRFMIAESHKDGQARVQFWPD